MIKNLYNNLNYLSAESHLPIGIFLGVNSPITGPILEGSRGYITYQQATDLGEARFAPVCAGLATSRPAVPTLPSRAHLQDYGRRTTPSNYIYIYIHTHIYIYTYYTRTHTYIYIYTHTRYSMNSLFIPYSMNNIYIYIHIYIYNH